MGTVRARFPPPELSNTARAYGTGRHHSCEKDHRATRAQRGEGLSNPQRREDELRTQWEEDQVVGRLQKQ